MSPPDEPVGGRRRRLRIGTRGSALALAQSGQTARRIERLGCEAELVVVRTSGDRLADVSLAKVGGKGLFLKELEEALARCEIDLAVHSMKDVPAELERGFAIVAVPARADVRDVLVARGERRDALGDALAQLPTGARVATGSLRRRAQLLRARPDLEVVAMRGNVDTRLAKLRAGGADAIVLAAAGLARLGLEVGAVPLEAASFLPAPGQGALAIEGRSDDGELRELLAPLHDAATGAACDAERAFLRALGASCQVPVAAFARPQPGSSGELLLDGLVASLDGREVLQDRLTGTAASAADLGARLAELLLGRGARRILDQAEREVGSL